MRPWYNRGSPWEREHRGKNRRHHRTSKGTPDRLRRLLSTAPEDTFLIDNKADYFAMDLELLKAVQPGPAPDRFVLHAAIGITRWYTENVLNQSLTEFIKDAIKSSFANALYDAVRRYPNLP